MLRIFDKVCALNKIPAVQVLIGMTFLQAAVLADIAGTLLKALALTSAGVHVFLEAGICQSEESELVRGVYGAMTAVVMV